MVRGLRHAYAVFKIYIQDGLAYRASGFIWLLTEAVTAITMPLVWAAAAGAGQIAGFSASDFVLYYLCMLMVSSFVTSHFMWEMSMEIKEGIFSVFLVRPMSYFQFMAMRNLAWRVVRTLLFLPMFVLLLYAYRGYLGGAELHFSAAFWISIVLGHLVSFFFIMAMGTIALFVQEARAIFELYYFPMLFLSGQLFPVALLPEWARAIAVVFPFYYTTALPTEILIGRLSVAQAIPLIGVQLVWIAGAYVAHRILWHYGLRQYAAVGM